MNYSLSIPIWEEDSESPPLHQRHSGVLAVLRIATANVTSTGNVAAEKSYNYIARLMESGFDNYSRNPSFLPHIFAMQELQTLPAKVLKRYGLDKQQQNGYDYQLYTGGVEQKLVAMAVADNFIQTLPSLHCGLNLDERLLSGKFRHRASETPFIAINFYGRVMEPQSHPLKLCLPVDQQAAVGRLFTIASEICLKEQCRNFIIMGDFNRVPLHLRQYDLLKNFNLYFRTRDGDNIPLPALWPPKLLRIDYSKCGGAQTNLEHSTKCDYIFVFGELFRESETLTAFVPSGVTPMEHKVVHSTLNLTKNKS